MLEILVGFRGNGVGERNISRCFESCDVGAVFVLNAEKDPHPSSSYFGEGNEERTDRIVRQIMRVYSIKDPIESEDRVDNHSKIVWPCCFIATDIPEEPFVGIGLEEGPIHQEIPDC